MTKTIQRPPTIQTPSRPGEKRERLFSCARCGKLAAYFVGNGFLCAICGKIIGAHINDQKISKEEQEKALKFVNNPKTLCSYCSVEKCQGCGLKLSRITLYTYRPNFQPS